MRRSKSNGEWEAVKNKKRWKRSVPSGKNYHELMRSLTPDLNAGMDGRMNKWRKSKDLQLSSTGFRNRRTNCRNKSILFMSYPSGLPGWRRDNGIVYRPYWNSIEPEEVYMSRFTEQEFYMDVVRSILTIYGYFMMHIATKPIRLPNGKIVVVGKHIVRLFNAIDWSSPASISNAEKTLRKQVNNIMNFLESEKTEKMSRFMYDKEKGEWHVFITSDWKHAWCLYFHDTVLDQLKNVHDLVKSTLNHVEPAAKRKLSFEEKEETESNSSEDKLIGLGSIDLTPLKRTITEEPKSFWSANIDIDDRYGVLSCLDE